MEEADDLSKELVIIDNGKIIAQGSPQSLKGRVGEGDVIEFRVPESKIDLRDQIVDSLIKSGEVIWAKSLGKELISFSALDGLKKIAIFYSIIEEYI